MFPTIKIQKDESGHYQPDEVVSADDLLRAFHKECDESTYGWLISIPMPSAIDHMADTWGIKFEYV